MISRAHLPSTLPCLRPCLPPAPNLWMLLLLFQIAWAWFHFGYERCNDDDRGHRLANFSFDQVHYSWKELKNQGSPRARWKNRENVLASANKIQANFLLFTERFHIQKMPDCILFIVASMSAWFDKLMSVSLPPYPIPHQCHQCSSVNRKCHNRPIRGYTGIQYTGTTLC